MTWPLLQDWNCYSVNTIGDGSCLFHAIYNGVAEEYRSNNQNSRYLKNMIVKLRRELSVKLTPDIYNNLLGGNLARLSQEFQSDVDDFSREGMAAALDSHRFIGHGFIEYIGDMLGLDIYILNADTQDVYLDHESRFCIKGRPSVVLLVYPPHSVSRFSTDETGGHYELIAREVDGVAYSRWLPDHPLIVMLRQRLESHPTWDR